MDRHPPSFSELLSANGRVHHGLTLKAYLLGSVEFETALRFQRRLHFEVSESRSHGALILCEHPPLISIGRQGSHAHLRLEDDARAPHCPLRWVNRGGGCILHMPGQLAVYPILPLDRLQLDVPAYLERLGHACLDTIGEFSLRAQAHADQTGVWVGDRLLAVFGVTVRDWVSAFGAYLNVHPALGAYRSVQTLPGRRMTSLECERRGPVRTSMVRQRLVEHLQAHFGFAHVALFTGHPAIAADTGRLHDCNGRRAASARCG
jgi:lipoyl(octanoyl) transferase